MRLRQICFARDETGAHTYSYNDVAIPLFGAGTICISVHNFPSQFEMALAMGLKPTQD